MVETDVQILPHACQKKIDLMSSTLSGEEMRNKLLVDVVDKNKGRLRREAGDDTSKSPMRGNQIQIRTQVPGNPLR